MKRWFLVAGLAIVFLFAGSTTIVILLTGDREPTALQPVALEAAAPPEVAALGAPPLATRPPSPAPLVADPVPARAAWRPPAQDPPRLVANRVIRKRVLDALRAAPIQSRLARCADPVGFGGLPAASPVPRARPPVLLLELEAPGGEVRIVEARVRDWGEASAAMVSCARDVLRGQVIPGSTIPRGERTWMPFPVNPRSDVMASAR
jgi:hypothetical protein